MPIIKMRMVTTKLRVRVKYCSGEGIPAFISFVQGKNTMKKIVLLLVALAVGGAQGYAGQLVENGNPFAAVGYQNDAFLAESVADAFQNSVKDRLGAARTGVNKIQRNDGRYIDCEYTNGFTIWGGGYGTWGRQKSHNLEDGYKLHAAGPALGIDWSNGAFTAGIAGTYAWGKIKGRSFNHDRDTKTWAITGYGQWTNGALYVNGLVGYGRNRFDGDHTNSWNDQFNQLNTVYGDSGKYHSNSWNAAAEVGYKFLLGSCFSITPNVGIRYFHDKNKAFSESATYFLAGANAGSYSIHWNREKYHVLELPIGVTFGYEIKTGNAVIVPQLRAAWVPEIDRKRAGATGYDSFDNVYHLKSARRNRNGFLVGAGLQARFSQKVSANLDYNVTLRNHGYEHNLNLGVGFTF